MSWNKMDGHSSSSSVQSDQGDGGDSKENIQPPKFSIYGTDYFTGLIKTIANFGQSKNQQMGVDFVFEGTDVEKITIFSNLKLLVL